MNVLLVGLGDITKKYKEGIIKNFNLVGLVDINPNASGIKYYLEYPYYKDLKLAIKNNDIDAVIIATPPKTHFKIIKEALENNLNVYVEKLVGFSKEELNELIVLSNKKSLFVKVMYHWQFGNELINLETKDFKINSIEIKIQETYTNDDNEVLNSKISLGNVLIDSLPNALSVLDKFIDVSKLIFRETEKVHNKDGVLIKIVFKFKYLNIDGKIILDWQSSNEIKETVINLEKGLIRIDHLNEITIINNLSKNNKTVDRLESHYTNLFKNIRNKQSVNLKDDKLQLKIIEVMEEFNE